MVAKLVFLLFNIISCSYSTTFPQDIVVSDGILERLSLLEEQFTEVKQLREENAFLRHKMDQQQQTTKEKKQDMQMLQAKLENQEKKIKDIEANHLRTIETMQTKQAENLQRFQTELKTQDKNIKEIAGSQQEVISKMKAKLDDHEAKIQQVQINCLETNAILSKKGIKHNDLNIGDALGTFNMTHGIVYQSENNSKTAKRRVHNPEHINNAPKHVKRVYTNVVAFSAALNNTLQTASPDHVIAFDKVLLNEGNGYNGRDGIFVCPVSGLYMFSYNIHLDNHSQVGGVQLKVNGVRKISSIDMTPNYYSKGNAAGTTVVRLNAGDHVWVAVFLDHTHAYRDDYSNFMGVLIAEYAAGF